jgi:hypothetical protein
MSSNDSLYLREALTRIASAMCAMQILPSPHLGEMHVDSQQQVYDATDGFFEYM